MLYFELPCEFYIFSTTFGIHCKKNKTFYIPAMGVQAAELSVLKLGPSQANWGTSHSQDFNVIQQIHLQSLKQERSMKTITLSRHNGIIDGTEYLLRNASGKWWSTFENGLYTEKDVSLRLPNWACPMVDTFRITQTLYNDGYDFKKCRRSNIWSRWG